MKVYVYMAVKYSLGANFILYVGLIEGTSSSYVESRKRCPNDSLTWPEAFTKRMPDSPIGEWNWDPELRKIRIQILTILFLRWINYTVEHYFLLIWTIINIQSRQHNVYCVPISAVKRHHFSYFFSKFLVESTFLFLINWRFRLEHELTFRRLFLYLPHIFLLNY